MAGSEYGGDNIGEMAATVDNLRRKAREAKRREDKLHLLSQTQAVLLRAHLTNRLQERTRLENDMLRALEGCSCAGGNGGGGSSGGVNDYEALAFRLARLNDAGQDVAVPPDVVDDAVARELEHLRAAGEEAVAEAEESRDRCGRLEHQVADLDRKNHKLQKQVAKFKDLLRDVREAHFRGELPAAAAGTVPEEDHDRLRDNYERLQDEIEELRSAQAAAAAAPPPPPSHVTPAAFMADPVVDGAIVSEADARTVAAEAEARAVRAKVAKLEAEIAQLRANAAAASAASAATTATGASAAAAAAAAAASPSVATAPSAVASAELAALRAELQQSRRREAAATVAATAATTEAAARLEKEREELTDAMAQEVNNVEARLGEEVKAAKKELKSLKKRWADRDAAVTAAAAGTRAARAAIARMKAEVQKELAAAPAVAAAAAAAVVGRVAGIDAEMGELRRQYARELRERRRLFNLVQELRGNIRVFCRCRPPTTRELEEVHVNSAVCVSFPADGEVAVTNDKGRRKAWDFDQVFGLESTQEQVYDEVSPLVTSVLDGYNACIFAYGQTGTGKTFTMTGPSSNRGVNTRALAELFQRTQQRADEIGDEILVSVLEIYNEQIRDLLSEHVGDRRLEVRQSDHGMHVPDLTMVPVAVLADVMELLELSDHNRSSACTDMNEHSSRSHMILSVYVTSTNKHTGAISRGKLHLIDLAGSERISKSGATGQALKEAQNINKSLSALGDVIAARANKQAHVPYRNSTLTYLLQDSLSADSKTLMFVCISPVMYNAEESFCSLNFASRVRTVELGKATRHSDNGAAKMAGGGGGAAVNGTSPLAVSSPGGGGAGSPVGASGSALGASARASVRKRV